jgi:hypothetical protein
MCSEQVARTTAKIPVIMEVASAECADHDVNLMIDAILGEAPS